MMATTAMYYWNSCIIHQKNLGLTCGKAQKWLLVISKTCMLSQKVEFLNFK